MKTAAIRGIVMSIVRTEKRERSVAGKFIKWAFVGFNILMAVWIVGGLHSVSQIQTHSTAEQIASGIGATIGVTFLLTLWALGDLILGILVLVTRGNTVIIEESSTFRVPFSQSSPESTFDLGRIDERIAQFKVESAPSPGRPLAAPSSQGFGKRRA
jgi:hypothetical protein